MTQEKTRKRKESRFKGLNKFLRQNKSIDWNTVNFVNEAQVEALNWKGLENDQKTVLKEVKAYQRLVRVLGENDPKLIKELLKKNIHSAIQVAAIPKQEFKKKYASVFKKDEEVMEKVHKKAVAIRSQLLLLYMNNLQKSEPHTGQVRSLGGK